MSLPAVPELVFGLFAGLLSAVVPIALLVVMLVLAVRVTRAVERIADAVERSPEPPVGR